MVSTFTLDAIVRPAARFGDFVAEKLAEISVSVVDLTGQSLASDLVAAANGDYRIIELSIELNSLFFISGARE